MLITCSVSGVQYKLHPAPAQLYWPHPALAYGLKFPTPRSHDERMLQLGAALYHLHESGLVRIDAPLTPSLFTQVWLSSALPLLHSLAEHIRGLGTDRAQRYPQLVLTRALSSKSIEGWLDSCYTIKDSYEVLDTPELAAANEKHRILVAARAKAIASSPVERLGFNQYLERCAIDCALDGDARYSFMRTCKNPLGSSDRAIINVMEQVADWAPQESIDDQLNYDALMQRLTDALHDSRTKQEAKAQQLNAELAKGLFRERVVTPSALLKERTNAIQSNKLAELLAKVATMK